MTIDDEGKHICQYNPECHCDVPECDKCGWNPKVAMRRLKKFRESLGIEENRYQIPFTGQCEVWAATEEEAVEKAERHHMVLVDYNFGDPSLIEEEGNDELDR